MTPPQGNPATQEFKWEDCADRRASLESRCLLGLYFIYPLRNASSSGMAGGSPGITTRVFFAGDVVEQNFGFYSWKQWEELLFHVFLRHFPLGSFSPSFSRNKVLITTLL